MEMESPINNTRGSLGSSLMGASAPFFGCAEMEMERSSPNSSAEIFMCASLAGVGLVASLSTMLKIEGDAVIVFDCATEDVQGAADGEVDAAVADGVDCLKVSNRVCTAGICAGDG